jgi:hypothetical protein
VPICPHLGNYDRQGARGAGPASARPAAARLLFPVLNGKRNFAPPADLCDWHRIESVELRNGDNVGVVTPWRYPGTQTSITPEIADRILAEIDQGLDNGQRYSNENAATTRGAFLAVQKHCPDKTRKEGRRIIEAWIKKGTLYEDEYDDPVCRKPVQGLYVRRKNGGKG